MKTFKFSERDIELPNPTLSKKFIHSFKNIPNKEELYQSVLSKSRLRFYSTFLLQAHRDSNLIPQFLFHLQKNYITQQTVTVN